MKNSEYNFIMIPEDRLTKGELISKYADYLLKCETKNQIITTLEIIYEECEMHSKYEYLVDIVLHGTKALKEIQDELDDSEF